MLRHIFTILCLSTILFACNQEKKTSDKKTQNNKIKVQKPLIELDTADYHKRLIQLANGDTSGLWPAASTVYPLKGAILPYNRIIAFYGNLYSKRMGILGELPPKELWQHINKELDNWKKTDSTFPVKPAIHYIVAVAQGTPMRDGSYCMRMPEKQIDSALAIAKMGDAIVFLDIQIGQSQIEKELPRLEKYLKMPNVHLAIDPEFAMKGDYKPGSRMGQMEANEINYYSEYLQKLVKDNNLAPKVLIVHRFTQAMVKNYKDIKTCPEVQIVMHMDGWGGPAFKLDTYKRYIYKEPVQFTGFKFFYKNDIKKPPHKMLSPSDLMKLKPLPVYIQYQ